MRLWGVESKPEETADQRRECIWEWRRRGSARGPEDVECHTESFQREEPTLTGCGEVTAAGLD